ncbi:unnamed protein product [Orchesella dallaii]|uniref:CRAL-TRIO domain-containing protein n=1 Tax=Orchesella dallaii TaxID=48710 RepID=A0ABP1QCK8_9HEXA
MAQPFLALLLLITSVIVKESCFVSAISIEKFLTLTLSEKIALDKFRERVQPMLKESYMTNDAFLIRFLRAQHFEIDGAEKMLRETFKWRKENAIDNMRQENWSDIASDFHTTIDTYDRTGQPVGVIDIYDWDIRRAVLQGKGQRLLRFVINLVENITTQMYERQELGMNVTQVVVLGNADGFNLIQHACPLCLPLWIQFVQIIESYYPHVLDELIVIDAPATIQVLLEAVRPFLSRSNREAIKVFGPNRSRWMEYLDRKMSKEERRPPYGGTKPPVKY